MFYGWHPQCICHQTPRLLTDAEYGKFEDEILGIGSFDGQARNEVAAPPEGFNPFLEKNKDRIDGWKNTAYWVRDKPDYAAILR